MMEFNGQTFVDEKKQIEVRNLKPEAIGHMVKKNWYGKKQQRFFELYPNGQL